MFCETRPLAEGWTYRWFGACLYELRAARSTAELELTLAPGSSIPGRSATTAEVRRWAQHNGLAVSDRGRISAEVLEA